MKFLTSLFLCFLSLAAFGADGYLARTNGNIVIGPGGSGGASQTPWTSDIDGGNHSLTNTSGITTTNLNVNGTGANFVSSLNVSSNLAITNITASRIVQTDGTQILTNVSASGAVPIDANGTATTASQVNALFPSFILTNNNSSAILLSNIVAIDAAHTLTASNIGASKLSGTDALGQFTNIVVGSGLSLSLGALTASGGIATNALASILTNGTSVGAITITNLNLIGNGGITVTGSVTTGQANIGFTSSGSQPKARWGCAPGGNATAATRYYGFNSPAPGASGGTSSSGQCAIPLLEAMIITNMHFTVQNVMASTTNLVVNLITNEVSCGAAFQIVVLGQATAPFTTNSGTQSISLSADTRVQISVTTTNVVAAGNPFWGWSIEGW